MSERRAERVQAQRSGVPIPAELLHHDDPIWSSPDRVLATFRPYVTADEVKLIRSTPALSRIVRKRVIRRWAVGNGYRDSAMQGQHTDAQKLRAAGLDG